METNKKLIIFVVEDNLISQQLIAKKLEAITDAIHFFTSGEDCILELADRSPDIIVLDNTLAGKLSGLDTLKAIRVLNPELCVIIFSARQDLATAENLSTYGHFEFVKKDETAFKHLQNKVSARINYLHRN